MSACRTNRTCSACGSAPSARRTGPSWCPRAGASSDTQVHLSRPLRPAESDLTFTLFAPTPGGGSYFGPGLATPDEDFQSAIDAGYFVGSETVARSLLDAEPDPKRKTQIFSIDVFDDDLAELDERFGIALEPMIGGLQPHPSRTWASRSRMTCPPKRRSLMTTSPPSRSTT